MKHKGVGTAIKTIKYVHNGGAILPLGSEGTITKIHPEGYDVKFLLRKKEFEEATGLSCRQSIVVYCPENSIIKVGN